MKLLYLVCFSAVSAHCAGQEIVVTDEAHAQRFYQAIRFFRIITKLPPELVSAFLPRYPDFKSPGSIKLFDIWNAIPDNVQTYRDISVRVQGEDVSRYTISCPAKMHKDLQVALAPLYGRESGKMLQLLGKASGSEKPKSEAIAYLQPMKKEDVARIDFEKATSAQICAYHIAGTRAYYQKICNVWGRLGNGLAWSFINWDTDWLQTWNGATKKGDAKKQDEMAASLALSLFNRGGLNIRDTDMERMQAMHIYKEGQLLDMPLILHCAEALIENTRVAGNTIVSVCYHQDLVRLAPRVTHIEFKYATAVDVKRLLVDRYEWPQLEKVVFHACEGISESKELREFRAHHRGVAVHIVPFLKNEHQQYKAGTSEFGGFDLF